jgi:archaellum component FlaC
MADQVDNFVLATLHKIDERLDRMALDVHDLKVRLTSVEHGFGGVNRRLERLDNRMELIEKRLELSDATH